MNKTYDSFFTSLNPYSEMQHSFVGRKRELQMLSQLFEKRSASLVVIRGRRRIGKSRLAQEFSLKTQRKVNDRQGCQIDYLIQKDKL